MSEQPAPWEQPDAQAPRIRINLNQLASGKWNSDRTCEFPAIDPLDPTSAAVIGDTLNALDDVVRAHVQELYARDGADLERYLEERERRGGPISYSRRSA